jgi:hypothetical protein
MAGVDRPRGLSIECTTLPSPGVKLAVTQGRPQISEPCSNYCLTSLLARLTIRSSPGGGYRHGCPRRFSSGRTSPTSLGRAARDEASRTTVIPPCPSASAGRFLRSPGGNASGTGRRSGGGPPAFPVPARGGDEPTALLAHSQGRPLSPDGAPHIDNEARPDADSAMVFSPTRLDKRDQPRSQDLLRSLCSVSDASCSEGDMCLSMDIRGQTTLPAGKVT